MNSDVIDRLTQQLGPHEANEIVRLARRVQKLENEWIIRIEKLYEYLARISAHHLLDQGKPPKIDDLNFDVLFTEFWFDVQIEAFKSIERLSPIPKRMAKKRRSLKDLIKERAAWRKGTYKPKVPRGYVKELKEEYLNKIHKYWKKHSDTFLEGEVYTQDEAFKKLTEDLSLGEGRAKTIIRTETTSYYNKVRKDYYDTVPDVTHYLFVAIRDHRTTEWCKTRDGIVYKKDSKLSWEIPPPVHYNCRSEILPLDYDNPNHKRLIDDKSLRRENNSCTPLPRGFKKR
jgi:SPP1 gp7 family putative phage head morphogenesis protein